MKIKLLDKLLMTLISVVLTAAGMIMFLVPFMYQEANTAPMKYILMVCGVLVLISGCAVWMLVCKYDERRKEYIVQQNECGPMRISVKAVEDLVQKCVDTHEEVKEDKIHIINGRDGVRVDLAVCLPNNISIPLAVDTLQKHVKNYLKASSGIDVTGVRISVNTTKGEIASESALDVTQQAAAPAAQEEDDRKSFKKAEEASKKKPAHQRIFGRSKQEIEEETREGVEAAEQAAEKIEEEVTADAEEAAAQAEETVAQAEEAVAQAEEAAEQVQEAAEQAAEEAAAPADETAEKEEA